MAKTALAEAGGGTYYGADNAEQLAQSLTEITEKVIEVEGPQVIFREEFDGPNLAEEWDIVNDNGDM